MKGIVRAVSRFHADVACSWVRAMLHGMSVRENSELHGLKNAEKLTEVLSDEIGAVKHPNQENALILQDGPLYTLRLAGDHISILSFNNLPLPHSLIEMLVDHPELFPDDTLIRWTEEQAVILEATLA